MNRNDELASIALGFKSESKKIVQENEEISIRYSKSQLLNIFKKMGNYVHPADQLSYFDVS
jgi:DNA-binding CsgD family transcriptional regulator